MQFFFDNVQDYRLHSTPCMVQARNNDSQTLKIFFIADRATPAGSVAGHHAAGLGHRQELALLSVSITGQAGMAGRVLAGLKRAIRQTDLLACTGTDEFSIATAGLNAAAARSFADRLGKAARAVLAREAAPAVVTVCCGVATLADMATDSAAAPTLHELWDAARRRGKAGMEGGGAGAISTIGAAEESAFAGK
jgi:hypothetical protein